MNIHLRWRKEVQTKPVPAPSSIVFTASFSVRDRALWAERCIIRSVINAKLILVRDEDAKRRHLFKVDQLDSR
jgi:hypothetical protein